jgi:hypothetical protein
MPEIRGLAKQGFQRMPGRQRPEGTDEIAKIAIVKSVAVSVKRRTPPVI